ncbi:galactose-specific lectin nattectin-like [Mytilus trossulus]|uniref:galactose-specific lectin nattectin-like n=1 Tax=Mytilus trossulus TaxID=6551 RepID=UPI003006B59D
MRRTKMPVESISKTPVHVSFLFLSLFSLTVSSAHTCDVRWIVGYSKCYTVHQKLLTWNEAMLYCQSRGGHLANIETEQERGLIQSIMETFNPGIYWLGGKDDITEGDWRCNHQKIR